MESYRGRGEAVVGEDVGLEELLVVRDAVVLHHDFEEVDVPQRTLAPGAAVVNSTDFEPESETEKADILLLIARNAVLADHVLDLVGRDVVDRAADVVGLRVEGAVQEIAHVSDAEIEVVSADERPDLELAGVLLLSPKSRDSVEEHLSVHAVDGQLVVLEVDVLAHVECVHEGLFLGAFSLPLAAFDRFPLGFFLLNASTNR